MSFPKLSRRVSLAVIGSLFAVAAHAHEPKVGAQTPFFWSTVPRNGSTSRPTLMDGFPELLQLPCQRT